MTEDTREGIEELYVTAALGAVHIWGNAHTTEKHIAQPTGVPGLWGARSHPLH